MQTLLNSIKNSEFYKSRYSSVSVNPKDVSFRKENNAKIIVDDMVMSSEEAKSSYLKRVFTGA